MQALDIGDGEISQGFRVDRVGLGVDPKAFHEGADAAGVDAIHGAAGFNGQRNDLGLIAAGGLKSERSRRILAQKIFNRRGFVGNGQRLVAGRDVDGKSFLADVDANPKGCRQLINLSGFGST